jgi:hypothetical protein
MDQSRLSRRSVLSGIGIATAAASMGVAMPSSAASVASDRGAEYVGPAVSSRPGSEALAAFTPTAGLSYLVIDATAWVGTGGTRAFDSDGTSTTPGNIVLCPLNLPLGSVLREIVLNYIAPVPPQPTVAGLKMRPGLGYTVFVPATPVAFAPGPLVRAFTVSEPIDGSASYAFEFRPEDVSQRVQTLLVGYQPPPPAPSPPPPPTGFIAAAPIRRVLDTRVSGGKLQNNEERVVATGIPAHAAAAVINLTVTETEQAGFVAAFPANSLWPGNSSINWSTSGQNLANSVITATDPTGHIRIRGGVNPTHVVIDVQGHFA